MEQNNQLHKAAFLGPKGENATELESLLLEVLRDHVFWRRNFHPSDPRLINERDKRTEVHEEQSARLRDELFQILARLKRAAPMYSPRQIAHMVSDPTLPALVGYFAGLLYNQNNVVEEVSPETVREERAYFSALAQMVAYPPFLPERLPAETRTRRAEHSWGHLCSGGTVANLEALWIARNVRLYPLAIRLVAHRSEAFTHFHRLEISRPTGERAQLEELTTYQLLNLPVSEITELHLRIQEDLADAGEATARRFQEAIPSVRKAGMAAFLLQYNEAFPEDPARLPRVFISQAAHYGWKKNMDILGLGADALVSVPVDEHIRLDVDALAERVRACADENRPVLGVISICGTTEEGAVDPLHEVEAFREEAAREGITFWHHCDAAFGGYFAAMLPKGEDGAFVPPEQLSDDFPLDGEDTLISEDVYRGIAAISETDSVTIDPHKFGYVPYPAGAVLFRDYHVRDAISYAAPYLDAGDRTGFGGFLGQWTLEGSRPGAAVVSCYLSQALVPLDESGHGQLIQNCMRASKRLVAALDRQFSDSALQLNPFAARDTVGYCFVLVPQGGFDTIEQLNDYTSRIWQHMTVDGREDINQYDYLISKTEIDVAAYRHVLQPVFGEEFLEQSTAEEPALLLLRSCIMNPFLHDWEARAPSFTERFAEYLHEVALREAPAQQPVTHSAPSA